MTSVDLIRNEYQQFAPSLALRSLLESDPYVFKSLADQISNDLEFCYEFPHDSFPSSENDETAAQTASRLELVSSWMDNQIEWNATQVQRRNIITLLFYTIWHLQNHEKCSDDNANLVVPIIPSSKYNKASLPGLDRQTDLTARADASLTMPPLGNIDVIRVLETALLSFTASDLNKYPQVSKDLGETVQTMVSMVTPQLLHILTMPNIQREE